LQIVFVGGQQFASIKHALLLHSSVLKPYFDLAIAETDTMGDLLAQFAADELVLHELAFEFRELKLRVGSPASPGVGSSSDSVPLRWIMWRYHGRRTGVRVWSAVGYVGHWFNCKGKNIDGGGGAKYCKKHNNQ